MPNCCRRGLVAPAGTPDAVVRKLDAAFLRAVREPDIVKQIADQGADAVTHRPAELAAFIASQTERFAEIARTVGVRRNEVLSVDLQRANLTQEG